MYINDLPSLTNISNFTLFAEETTVEFSGYKIKALTHKCNVVLHPLNAWSLGIRLTINFEKETEFLIFSNWEHQIEDQFISVGQNSIQDINNYKFLGVTMDNILPFRDLVNIVLSKVSKPAGLLYQL